MKDNPNTFIVPNNLVQSMHTKTKKCRVSGFFFSCLKQTASISSETKYKTVKKLYVEIVFDYSVSQSNQINWATMNICIIK